MKIIKIMNKLKFEILTKLTIERFRLEDIVLCKRERWFYFSDHHICKVVY